MGMFRMFGNDINKGVQEWRETQGAVLLDVRNPDEYRQGHIPGSVNLPLSNISQIASVVPDVSTPLFVHCLSGARSGQAVSYLKGEGYNAKNIGGINGYKGEIAR